VWQFYCALFGVNSMQSWVGWKLLSCKKLETIFGTRGLTRKRKAGDLN